MYNCINICQIFLMYIVIVLEKDSETLLKQNALIFRIGLFKLDSQIGLFRLDLGLTSFLSWTGLTTHFNFSSRSPLTVGCVPARHSDTKVKISLCNYQIKITLLTSYSDILFILFSYWTHNLLEHFILLNIFLNTHLLIWVFLCWTLLQ